jgi:general L-amino acid transport system ATP-binding protein
MAVVTQEMGFAREFATQVIFMDRGRIIEAAAPAEFFSNPREGRTQAFLRQILRGG